VIHARAAPAVDGLVVVAHGEEIVALRQQLAQPQVLDAVGVLELVHQHVAEALTVVGGHLRILAEQLQGAQQQVAEVHQAAAVQGGLVAAVQLHDLGVIVAARRHLGGGQGVLLEAVDGPLHPAGVVGLVVHPGLLDHSLHRALLVLGVQDLEIAGQLEGGGVGAQDAVAQAVEGADPQVGHADAQQLLHPFAHLAGGLVGEGHRQDGAGGLAQVAHQVGDAVGEHAGLAAAGSGQDQAGAGGQGHRGVLLLVQAVKHGSPFRWGSRPSAPDRR